MTKNKTLVCDLLQGLIPREDTDRTSSTLRSPKLLKMVLLVLVVVLVVLVMVLVAGQTNTS